MLNFGVKQIWDHHVEAINLLPLLSISFSGLKILQGFCFKKIQNGVAKYGPEKSEEEILFRTSLELQFYSSCKKVTQNIFPGGDKISQVRNILTSR